jgi:hypothetical protein
MTAIDDFFTHYYARRPVNATFTGVHAYDDHLPNWSLDGLAATEAEMESLGVALSTEYPTPASVAAFRSNPDLLDAELARGSLEIQRAENASMHGPRGNPALWTGEAVFSIIALMIRDFAPIEDRVVAASNRLEATHDTFLCAPSWLSNNAQPLPRSWKVKAQRDCEGAAVLLGKSFDLWLQSASLPSHFRAQFERAAREARRALAETSRQLDAQPDAADSAVACGPDLYDLYLTLGHFCTRSRPDLLGEARERFEAAQSELDLLARSVSGTWADAQLQLAADRPTRSEYFGAFEKTWNECRDAAERANVITWPDNWLIHYTPYPAWTAEAAPYLYYLHYRSPAPFDEYTTYDYVVPALPSDADAADRHLRVWNHSTIKLNHVVHHGAIGHHVQNWYAYNQQRSRVGKVAAVDCANRIGMFLGGTMAEGWACYATDLMEEIGFLTPLERVAQQHTRVRMLARAIVDIELHQGTMSFQQAVQFYVENVGMNADAARGEAVKNSMYPCTAIMYWLGTQGIHDLRDEMKRREGPRFNLRRFHGELLGYGSIPVPLVSRMLLER